MKHLLKKTISAILPVLLLASQIITGSAEESEYKLSYMLNGDGETVTVTGFEVEPSGDYDLVIPRKVSIEGKSYIVTAIADGEGVSDRNCSKSPFGGYMKDGKVFYNESMKSLSLPNTLKKIGNGAFYACSGLTEIEIPDSVTEIGGAAFCYCGNIKSVGVLPVSITKIGMRAFSYITKLSGVVNIPYAAGSKSFESSMQVQSDMYNNQIVINEGVTESPGNIYGTRYMETLIFPSTLKKAETSQFTGNSLERLQSVYILSDEFKFSSVTKIDTGKNAATPTKWYVRNESVKEYLADGGFGIDASNVIVMDKNVVVFSESNATLEIRELEQDSVILHEPEREGYEFKYWTDGTGIYFPGESYTADKSVVMQAVWKKTYEKENVLYKSVNSDGNSVQIENSPVGRIICSELANQASDVIFVDENGFEESFTAEFDSDGLWINYESDSPYVKVEIDGVSGFSALVETDENYEAVVGLREPAIFVYPRIDGMSDLEGFNWKSSDVTVARAENGVITGYKSGEAVLTAEYGDKSYSIKIIVAGEIAIAKEEGKEAKYIAEKKPIIDAINAAIEANSAQDLADVLTGAGEIKLSDIRDIDTTNFELADYDTVLEFAERIITYGSVEFDDIDDVVSLSDMLSREFELGKLNHKTDIKELESIISEYNGYYGFDLDNKYYKRNKDDALAYFLNYTAVNLSEANRDFENAYVMSAVRNAANYSALAAVIEDSEREIGYSKEHYTANKCSDMHKSIIENRNSIKDIEALKKYIDSYTKPKNNANSSGSGSGGGGSSVKKSTSVSVSDIYNPAPAQVNDTSLLFTDLENDRWSHNAVAYLVSQNVIAGYSDGSFRPNNGVSRAEFIKIVSAAFGFTAEPNDGSGENEDTSSEDDLEETNSPAFNDVSESDWFYPYVAGAFDANVISGDENGNFNPNATLTRQEAAAIIHRVYGILGFEAGAGRKVSIADINSIDDWAYTPVLQLMQSGILSGYSDSTFRPHAAITREEAAKIVYEMLQKKNGGN